MWYRVGADVVVVIHLLFIAFVVGGAFLAWRWPLIIWGHIPAVIYGALIEFAGFTCPLTVLENDLRLGAGYSGGFIDHYLIKVIYPPGLTHEMQIGLGVSVLLVAMLGYWGFLRRHYWGERWRMRPSMGAQPGHRDVERHHPGGAAIEKRRLAQISVQTLSSQSEAEVGCSDCGDDNARLARHWLIHRH
jgi:hypothetical protein